MTIPKLNLGFFTCLLPHSEVDPLNLVTKAGLLVLGNSAFEIYGSKRWGPHELNMLLLVHVKMVL